MKYTTLLVTVLATSALALPKLQTKTWTDTEMGFKVRNVGFQGDGFYLATFDDNGVAEVEFTPVSEFNLTTPVVDILPDSEIVARNAGIVKRAPTCDKSHHGNAANMDIANIQLAKNAQANDGGTGYYPKNAWGWVFFANEA